MRKLVEDLVTSALSRAVQSGELALSELPAPSVERPRDLEHGDWATSVALKLAKEAHMNPRQIAEIIASHMESPAVERIEVAGPGFINVKLADSALQDVVQGGSAPKTPSTAPGRMPAMA